VKSITYCLLLLNFSAAASVENSCWHNGAIVLRNDKVVVGRVQMEELYDIILFIPRDSNHVEVYPAFKLKSIRFFDSAAQINRRYVSVQPNTSNNEVFQLFEIVVAGQVSVVRRLKAFHAAIPDDATDFTYYSLHQAELVELKKFATKVYPKLLYPSDNQLNSYARHNRLNPNQLADAIILIKYFNTMCALGEVITRR